MDNNLKAVIEKRAQKVISALEKNNMAGYFVQDEAEAIAKIKEICAEGDTVSVGGSETLKQAGVLDLLRNGKYNFLDRYEKGLTKEQVGDIFRKTFFADTFFTSTNAITESGELYNVDGNGNRVAAMMFGPKKVIVVAGINKIVKDIDEAEYRVKSVTAPANCLRLNKETPCTKTGYCVNCASSQRTCNLYTVIKRQNVPGRLSVIIINKNLGY